MHSDTKTPLEKILEERRGDLLVFASSISSNPEDLLQEAIYRALKYQSSETNIYRWLKQIIRNTAIDQYRKDKDRDVETLPPDYEIPVEDAVTEVLHKDFRDHLLSQLPPVSQQVWALRHFQGFSYEEISTITGLSITSIKSRLNRTKTALEKSFQAN